MPVSFSILTLIASLALSLFLGLLNFWFWRVQREDRTPLWLAIWLSASASFTLCRLLQYASLSVSLYLLVPRILLTIAYTLVWLAYELGNSFIDYRPSRLERSLVVLLIAVLFIFLWTGNLVLTDQIVMRTVAFGGEFTGVQTGILYLPVSILILVIGGVPVIRLGRASDSHRWENRVMATCLSFIIFSSLCDFIATARGLIWIRFSDFSYLPVAICFCYIQVQRFGRLYRSMDVMVRGRTAELSEANETLGASEARYRKLIDTARDIIFTISTDGRFTSINPSFEVFTGWARDEWLGRLFDDLIAEEDRPRARDLFSLVLRAEALSAIRLHVPTRTGAVLVVELNLSPQVKDGQVVGLLGIARDMTEEQRAEDALRESEEQYRAVVEHANDGITIIQKGRVRYVNPRLAKMRDENIAEIIGQRFDKYIHLDERNKILERYRRRLDGENEPTIYETMLVRKDQSKVLAELTTGLITYRGMPAEIVIVRDITERKQAENVLKESEKRLRLLLQISQAMAVPFELNTILQMIVENATQLWNLDSGAIYLLENDKLFLAATTPPLPPGIPESFRYASLTEHPHIQAAVSRGATVILPDSATPDLSMAEREIVEARGLRSIVYIPLIVENQTIGVLILGSVNELRTFREEETALYYGFAGQAAQTIENVRLYEATHRHAAELVEQINERKQAEIELNAAMTRLTTLLEHMQSGILFEDTSRRVSIVNQTFCDLFRNSASASTLVGADCREAAQLSKLLAADPEKFIQRIEVIIASRRLVTAEEILLVDGRVFERDYIPIMSGDDLTGHLWQYRDITERKLAERTLSRQLQEMIALNMVSAAGTEAIEVDELIERVTVIIEKMLYPDNCGILLADEKTKTWRSHPSYWGTNAETVTEIHPFSEGIAGKVIASGKIVRVTDTRQEPAYLEATSGIRSEIAVPIVVGGKIFGCLNAESKELEAFSEHDERLMNTIVGSMSTSIEKIQLLHVEKRRREEAEILYNTTRDLVAERNLPSLLQTIVERAVGMLGSSSGGLYLCEPEKRQLRCVVSYKNLHDYKDSTLKYSEGAAGTVAETGQPLVIEDYRIWKGRAAVYEQDQPFISVLSVPMRWQDQVIGVIDVLENTKIRVFTQEELKIANLFAHQAAIAVENARLFNETRQRAEEFAALYETTRDLSGEQDVDALLSLIVERAVRLLKSHGGVMYLYDASRNDLEMIVALNDPQGMHQHVQLGSGASGRVAQTRTPLIIDDYQTWEGRRSLNERYRALVVVPMSYRGNLIGVLDVFEYDESERKFNAADAELLSLFASRAAGVVHSARLFESEQRRRKEAAAIAEVGRDISESLQLEVVLDRIATNARELLNAETSAVYLLEPSGQSLRAVIAIGMEASELRNDSLQLEEGILGQIAMHKTGEIVNDTAMDPRAVTIPGTEMLAFEHLMGVPVLFKGELTGLIAVWKTGAGQEFKQEDLDFLNSLAQQVSVAIENARLFETTRQRLKEIESVHTVSTALRSAQTLGEALPIILDQLTHLLDAGGASLEMIDPVTDEIVTEWGYGAWRQVGGLRTPLGSGISGRVIATGKPYVSADVLANGKLIRPDLLAGLNAVACVPIIVQQQAIGTLWIGRESPIRQEEISLLAAIGEMVGNAIQRMKLHEQTEHLLHDLQIAAEDLAHAYETTLEGWAKALELRDRETEGHSRRVVDLAMRLARCMGVSEPELTHIHRGVLLHDIGKMGITDQLLRKTGPLTEVEWIEMRKHPQYAYDLLYPISYLRPALDIPYCHHEKWDGSGYPRGLKEEQIPLAARIFAIVDVYDALVYDRPYRAAWPRRKVLNYLRDQSGKHFDPEVVNDFIKMLNDKRLVDHEKL